jgi:uncharacterized caspase-like protein
MKSPCGGTRAFLVIAVLAWATGTAWAQSGGRTLAVEKASPPVEYKIALVIGNGEYKEARLANPPNDAQDIGRALADLGFKVTVKVNANQKAMKQAIREFGTELKRGGVGLFYFAGHGVQSKGRNFLIPVGASLESEADLEDESVDANLVLSHMDDAQNRVNIVVLDACRNNPFARSFRSASRGLAQMDAAKGTFVAFATAPGSVAADGSGRNGVYTKHLLLSLREGESDIEKVFKRVRAGVMRETGDKQVPWESSSLVGDFLFRPEVAAKSSSIALPPGAGSTPAPVAPQPATDPAAIELAYWDSIKNSTDVKDYQAYLQQYPQGRFAQLAKNRIQSLNVRAARSEPVQQKAPEKDADPVKAMRDATTTVDSLKRIFK